ncbi:tetratricopeptide repeat protein [Longimicrobium sp.]|uniref:tetratricopeptide repeat protein n=1 Tax=Longimicrobium sp. TaxID=2029185 RepID=UPI002E33CF0B|nr:tetratricopeptide repeat protein [Longimicrobium sp.]HEX6037692.1 tetratricopeptide repeat protein [Longimicrobium sp.]
MPAPPVPPTPDPRLALARWYNDQMATWNESFVRGGDDIFAALRAFDRVSDHVRGLLPWLAARAQTDDAAAEVCMRIPLAAGIMAVLRFEVGERIPWSEAALACARRLGNVPLERAHLEQLGSLYIRFEDPARAIGCFRAALDLHGERPAVRARLLASMGQAYADQGDVAEARRTLEEAVTISRAEGETDVTAIALLNLGGLYNHVGRPREAIVTLDECLRIAAGPDADTVRAEALNSLGNAFAMLGALDSATASIQQAMATYRRLGFEHGIATCLLNLGIAHVERGDTASAVETLEEALRMIGVPPSNQADRLSVRCKTLNRLGKARGMQGDLNEARRLFGEALEIAEAVQDSGEIITACVGLGYMRLDIGDLDAAEAWFERAITLAQGMGDLPGLASGLLFRAQVLRARGEHAVAKENAGKALAIYEGMNSPKAAALHALMDEWDHPSPRAHPWRAAWRWLRNRLA